MNMKNLWQDKRWMKTPEFAALASGVIYGMLVHSFAMNNVLHNHDNIASQPGGFGTSVPLGRWFLEYLGQFLDKAGLNYNLPFVNGLVYILLLSAAAAVLVSTLKLRSRGSAILVGALFVAFPTVTATMIYRFTVIFYGISALLATMPIAGNCGMVANIYTPGDMTSAHATIFSTLMSAATLPAMCALLAIVL